LEHLTDGIRALGQLGRTAELASALCNLGGLFLLLGDGKQARVFGERSFQLADRLGNARICAFARSLAADIDRREGHSDRALEGYEQAARLIGGDLGTGDTASMARSMALALIDEQRFDQAASLIERLDRRIDATDPWAEIGARLHLARATGRAGGAPSNDAIACWQVFGQRLSARCAMLERRGALGELWRAAVVLAVVAGRANPTRPSRASILDKARTVLEEVMDKAPEIYREPMVSDPDARSLIEQWRAMVEAGANPKPSSAANSPPAASHADDQSPLRRLLTINKRLNSELRLPVLLELIVDTVIELTEAERGFLILAEDDHLEIKVARNIDRRTLETRDLALSRSIAEQAASSGSPVITIDASEDGRFKQAVSVDALSLRSVLAVPLAVKGRTVGTIYVDHRLRKGVFDSTHVALVQDLADQAAIAIENARLLAENQRTKDEIEALNRQLVQQVERQQDQLTAAEEELRSNRQALQVRYDYGNIIGRTPRMLELFHLLDRVTDTQLPVVIYGESGTGKELVARAIHHHGARAERPFVGENCGAIPETLLESVLFGHARGAFTGAERDRRGLFEFADSGTLFLDEVGEMSAAMQTKLLRVLQDGEFRRVGCERLRKTDVRLIAASNRDLAVMVREGRFREDLYYRLNVIPIEIPALRQRREDIQILVEHFLKKHAGGTSRRVSREAMTLLAGYHWPGNVRELENEIMRAVALSEGTIGAADLSLAVRASDPLVLSDENDLAIKPRVEHLERELIRRALDLCRGNQSRAARRLGLSRYGLLKKMKRFFPEGLER
jgi:transcriptional regulator with GAF, ATPase, and Fis domain